MNIQFKTLKFQISGKKGHYSPAIYKHCKVHINGDTYLLQIYKYCMLHIKGAMYLLNVDAD